MAPTDTLAEFCWTPYTLFGSKNTFAAKAIPFSRVDTDPGITMGDCQHIDAKIGIHIVKTIFLCNRQQTEFYLYVTSNDKPSPALSSSVRGTCWTSIWKGGS